MSLTFQNVLLLLKRDEGTLNTNQGILNSTGTETIAKEPKFAKLLQALKSK